MSGKLAMLAMLVDEAAVDLFADYPEAKETVRDDMFAGVFGSTVQVTEKLDGANMYIDLRNPKFPKWL